MKLPSFPKALTATHQWLIWRPEKRGAKWTKVPYAARTGEAASTTDAATWAPFAEAVEAARRMSGGGVGFVFTEADSFVGVDLDGCRDPESGTIEPWALEIVEALNSYTEVTPSGAGLHIILLGKLPAGRRRTGKIEMYESGRFFTMTGQTLPGYAEIAERADAVLCFHKRVFGEPAPPRARLQPTVPLDLDDRELLARARQAKNGDKFRRLFDEGDTNGHGGDDSAADLALVNELRFWTQGDGARMDRLFRQSALYREKWDERRGAQTYGERTIETSLSGGGEVYMPGNGHSNGNGRTFTDADAPPAPESFADGLTLAELPRPIDLGDDAGEGDMDDGEEPKDAKEDLWKRWVGALDRLQARLLWTDTSEAYLQLRKGEVLAVDSDPGALWFQQQKGSDRDAYYGSEKWRKAAGAVRSWARQHGDGVAIADQSCVRQEGL